MLKNQVAGLKDGAHLLVIEGIMPQLPIVRGTTLDERYVWFEDLFVMTVQGSYERTKERYVELSREADPRLEFVAQTGGQDGAFQSILDFVFKA
ncbi:Uu.00g056250.m01.CDS01 [Anthostomella pinea]|uniref:Uu.00g056250.m01.CDS01 n=1 Tax=Anthostomella pinea TaxID=933095 RepID=A0AAI8YM66_9PEZI|nr:Uu.00g056250.m01.CDS01 [Anthostomella pinea]